MLDTSAPILEVNHAYLIGESERGTLYTNDLVVKPVLAFMNLGPLTESVSIRGNMQDELSSFLHHVHGGQVHVGELFMFNGRTRIDLNPGLAALYQVNNWPGHANGIIMACAQGFMMTSLSVVADNFNPPLHTPLPLIRHYQLAWVDRNGDHHAFRDLIEVK